MHEAKVDGATVPSLSERPSNAAITAQPSSRFASVAVMKSITTVPPPGDTPVRP